MKRIISYSLIILLINGCYSFYKEIRPKESLVKENYSNKDTTFILKDYVVTMYNGRNRIEEVTTINFEDSILAIFKKSAQKVGLNIFKMNGKNLNKKGFSFFYDQKNIYQKIINQIDSTVSNDESYDCENRYIIPYIRLVDGVLNTSFNTGNVYINKVYVGVMIFIIENKSIIYLKYFHGDGVSDNKEKVTDDWPNYPSPPDVLYEQAHWDTLVGLAMEDYMKRLNVEKR